VRDIEYVREDHATVKLSITGDVTGTAASDPNRLFAEEGAIRSIRIYVFNRHSADGTPEFEKVVYKGDITDVWDNYNYSLEVLAHGNKEFYVIVNEPLDLWYELSVINSVEALQHLTYEFAAYFNNGFAGAAFCDGGDGTPAVATFDRLPLFGEATGQKVNAVNYDAIEIPVHRSLARVDLNLKDISGGDVTLTEHTSFEYTTYPTGRFSSLSQKTEKDKLGTQVIQYGVEKKLISSSSFERVLSFYTPARVCSVDEDRIKIYLRNVLYKGINVSYAAPIIIANSQTATGELEPIYTIDRNTIYNVNTTIRSDFSEDWITNLTILPWNDVILHEDIEDTDVIALEVSKDVSSKVPNQSHIDVECTQGLGDIYISDSFGPLTGGYHDLGDVTLLGTDFPDWLVSVKWSSSPIPAKENRYTFGQFTLLRKQPSTVEESLKSYTMRVKCGTVTQLITLGYIPTSGEISITVDDWVDTDSEEDLTEGKEVDFTSPQVVKLDKAGSGADFVSDSIAFTSTHEVRIYVPTNAEGSSFEAQAVDGNDGFLAGFEASVVKPSWLSSARLSYAADLRSGVFHFSTTSSEFHTAGSYIIKLKSQNVVRYMRVELRNKK
jgi:hypothetical protein